MHNDYAETNRDLWNGWTRLHSGSAVYDVDGFKAGKTTLRAIELAELGDVSGKSLLHLQCHFGLDTLSWARNGALVTGVDFSDEAIALAQSLSSELDIPAEFICSDLFALPGVLDRQFDIVFTSYGVVGWLADLNRWAELIARYLRPGGTFYIVEHHPFRRLLFPRRFDDMGKPLDQGYFQRLEPVRSEERGSYAEPGADYWHTAYYWMHGLGEIVTALVSAGLRLQFLHEHPDTVEHCYAYEEVEPGQYVLQQQPSVVIPHLFSIRATR